MITSQSSASGWHRGQVFRHKITFNQLLKNVIADSEETKDEHIDGLIQNTKRCLGEEWWQPFDLALSAILSDIKDDLSEFGANFDKWFSEKSLVSSGEIDMVIAKLEDRGHLYEKAGALWFRSTDFGDDKDRVVRRETARRPTLQAISPILLTSYHADLTELFMSGR